MKFNGIFCHFRTLASAQALAAGLFPPISSEQIWHEKIQSQLIPIHDIPITQVQSTQQDMTKIIKNSVFFNLFLLQNNQFTKTTQHRLHYITKITNITNITGAFGDDIPIFSYHCTN